MDHPEPAAPKVGDVVAGRFRIFGTVGKGAMGAVYAAEHVSSGQRVALKFMTIGDEDGEEFYARFEQEARVMAKLRHPNTVRLYDFGRTDDGAMFMAMELLEGQGLDRRIREIVRKGDTMAESEAARYGVQILKSLAEAHGNGLVHRDLKPGNVFLTDDGSGEELCKVLDFGIARVSDSSMTNAGRLLGTPSYMSPEQWQAKTLDGRSDLYAVGCILHCCVTGKPPFSGGDNPMALMTLHIDGAIPDPRGLAKQPLSDAFVQVIGTALAKDPRDRYADARSMRAALEAVLGGAWAGTPSRLISPGTEPYSTPRTAAPTVVDVDATLPLNTQRKIDIGAAGRTLVADTPRETRAQAVGERSKIIGIALVATVLAAVAAWWLVGSKPPAASAADASSTGAPAAAASVLAQPKARASEPEAPAAAEHAQPATAPKAAADQAPIVAPAPAPLPQGALPPAAPAATPTPAPAPAPAPAPETIPAAAAEAAKPVAKRPPGKATTRSEDAGKIKMVD